MLGFEGSDSEVLDRNGGYELHGPLDSAFGIQWGKECGSLADLEDHPRTSKWLVSNPPFTSHKKAIWKYNHNPT